MLRYVALIALIAVYPIEASGQTSAKPDPAAAQDKVVCKRFAVTGSLVDSTKVCKTNREWQKERDDMRASADSTPYACRTGAVGSGC